MRLKGLIPIAGGRNSLNKGLCEVALDWLILSPAKPFFALCCEPRRVISDILVGLLLVSPSVPTWIIVAGHPMDNTQTKGLV